METNILMADNRLKEDVKLLKEWASKQPHLPKIESEEWLKMCLYANKYNIEKTKTKIDKYFSYRNKYPKVLKNRDPRGLDITSSGIGLSMSWPEKLTKNGERLIFWKFEEDPSLYDATVINKRGFMVADLIFLEKEKHSSILVIIDCQHFGYQHFLKGLPGVKVAADIFFNAYSDRLKAFHLIRMPVGTETLLNTIITFLPKKYSNKFIVHSSPGDLCKEIDEDIVCSDFGGKGPAQSVYEGKPRMDLLQSFAVGKLNINSYINSLKNIVDHIDKA